MPTNNTTNATVPEKQETRLNSLGEPTLQPHRIAELIGVFEDDPVWDAIMDEVRTRRRIDEQEEVMETTALPVEVPTLRK